MDASTAIDLLVQHSQQRLNSCFQSAPEMALKLAGILPGDAFPFQQHADWDGRGYEPYVQPLDVNSTTVSFSVETFTPPYGSDLFGRLDTELTAGRFPVLSLRPSNSTPWHGYVAFAKSNNDYLVLTKSSPMNRPADCVAMIGRLSWYHECEKIDCLFYTT